MTHDVLGRWRAEDVVPITLAIARCPASRFRADFLALNLCLALAGGDAKEKARAAVAEATKALRKERWR